MNAVVDDGTAAMADLQQAADPTGSASPPEVVDALRDGTVEPGDWVRQHLQARLLDAVEEAVVATDRRGRVVYRNLTANRLYGRSDEDVVGRPLDEVVREVVSGTDVGALIADLERGGSWSGEVDVRAADGTTVPVRLTAGPYTDDDGRPAGVLAVTVDLRDRRRRRAEALRRGAQQAALAELGQRALGGKELHALLADAVRRTAAALGADLVEVLELDPDRGRLVRRWGAGWPSGHVGAVDAGEYALPALRADHPVALLQGDGARDGLAAHGVGASLMVSVAGRDGAWGVLAVHRGQPLGFSADDVHFLRSVGNVIAAAVGREAADAELERLALHDALTGLPNRALFVDRVRHGLERARERGTSVAVLFADLDRFKLVNDGLGHSAGDRLLVLVAERMRSVVRPNDTVARLGGDEFALLCEDLTDAGDAVGVAERLADAMARPFLLGGTELFVTASVGVVVAGAEGDGPESLLRDADAAMYRAKDRGRARHEVFDDQMRVAALTRLGLSRDLRWALDRDELHVVYQPVVDISGGRARTVEALLRWRHPVHGQVSPGEFIPLAEESGLIVPIGAWVLGEACRQAVRWEAEGHVLGVNVNLSPRHFCHPALVDTVAAVLRDSGLEPSRLCLEITESTVMDEPEAAIEVMEELKALGVGLAIDDFGTGYSSLGYLKRFPVDALKVDRSFVGGLGSDLQDRTIAAAVVGLAHALGLTAVAEGVETEHQLEELRALGCDSAQGFLWSRPIEPAALVPWLRAEPAAAPVALPVPAT